MANALPTWLRGSWWIVIPGSALLTSRIVYEETYVTWHDGPGLTGYALTHGSGFLFAWLWVSTMLAHVWLAVAGAYAFRGRRSATVSLSRPEWLMALLLLVIVVVGYIQPGTWRRLVISGLGPGLHGPEFLAEAAARGDMGTIDLLMQRGIPINAVSLGQNSALNAAAANGRLEVVRFILARGGNPNLQSGALRRSPLMNSAEMGRAEVVRSLLEAGADPNAKDEQGETALMIARRHGRQEVVHILTPATSVP